MSNPEEIKAAVAVNLVKLRGTVGMTQLQLAEKLAYSDKAVSKWERGESIPDVFVLKQIADLFGVTVDYLINEHDDKNIRKVTGRKDRFVWISLICLCGIAALSTLLFVLSWIFADPIWLIFLYALPVMMIVMLVLSSVFGFRKLNFWWVSGLVISLVLCLYLTFISFLGVNIYQLLILLPPAEFVVFSAFGGTFKNKKR